MATLMPEGHRVCAVDGNHVETRAEATAELKKVKGKHVLVTAERAREQAWRPRNCAGQRAMRPTKKAFGIGKDGVQVSGWLVAMGGKVIKCPSPLNVLKYTCDHSCY